MRHALRLVLALCSLAIAFTVHSYIGESAQVTPRGIMMVHLNEYPPPDLALKVGDTSLSNDLNHMETGAYHRYCT